MKAVREYYLKKALRDHRETLAYSGWKNVKSILILLDRSEDFGADQDVIRKHFAKLGPEVHFFTYAHTKKPKEALPENTYFKRDVLYIGRPKKAILNQALQTDVLIDWSQQERSPNDFIVANSDAGLKVGVNRNLPCFDLLVKQNGNEIDKAAQEIMNYLKLINK